MFEFVFALMLPAMMVLSWPRFSKSILLPALLSIALV